MRRAVSCVVVAAALTVTSSEAAAKTIVVLVAHADDEAAVAPMLARYAREGAQIYLVIATDGSQGFGSGIVLQRDDLGLRGDRLVSARAQEARCATDALGIHEPILLDFPDGKLGDYVGDRSLVYRLTERIATQLQQIRPDVLVTWGPDGGTGHPDHRIVGDIATQLVRAGTAGVPERLFYMTLPVEMMRAVNPRGEPPMLVPLTKYFSVRIGVEAADLAAAVRAARCHRSQLSQQLIDRLSSTAAHALPDRVLLAPAVPMTAPDRLFSDDRHN